MGNCFVSKESSSDIEKKKGKNSEEKYKQQQVNLEVDQDPQSGTNIDSKRQGSEQKILNDNPKIQINEGSKKEVDNKKEKENENEDDQRSLASDAYTDEAEIKGRKDKNKKAKKMKGDYREEAEIYENISKIERSMSKADLAFVMKSLSKHFVFTQLSQNEKEQICQKMYYCENSQDYIFNEGDNASSYFIIEKGECHVIINKQVRRKLKAGDGFGELALLYGAKRSASILCKEPCSFWAIDRIQFRKSIEEIVSREYETNRQFIEKTKFFNVMTPQQKDSVAHGIISILYQKKGTQVVCQGDQASSYYIIKKGSMLIQIDGKVINKLQEGDEFGEQALTQDSYRGATVLTDEDNVILLSIGRDQIQQILGNQVQTIIFNNLQKWAIEKNPLLSKLTKIQVEKLLGKAKIREIKKNDVVYEKDHPCSKLVFLLEGKIRKATSGRIIAERGQLLGEHYLLQRKQKDKFEDDILMESNGFISEIHFKTFFEVIGGSLEKIIDKNKDSHEQFMKKYDGKEAQKYVNWKLSDLTSIKKLGFGQFGSVYLCKNKDFKGEYYALKVISKAQVLEQNLEKHLLQEKKVLENVHFPFIMKFIRTFKDNNNVYFLVQYVKGMELFDVIREIGLLMTYDSQFYVGSILLCIEYLHTQSIIYRDIKPENIMVDHKGYIKLIDMGTAKFLKGNGGRTHTIIGTPHYMAPEIISGKGYTYNVDLWSIGVCLYEFMCGGVPFAEEAEDPYEIYEEIMRKGSLTFPSWLKDYHAKKLMQQLLSKTPEIRLGNSYAALKANPWFDNFDWDKLMKYELKPPYVPPKDKVIQPAEIKKLEERKILVADEVKKEQGNIKYNKSMARDPNWDSVF